MRSLLLLACVATAGAHDIPADLAVHAFVKPAGNKLQLIVRMPLRAVRDVDFPEFSRGYLDIEKLSPQLPGLALLWIGNVVEIEEDGVRLMNPRVIATQLSFESDRSFESFELARDHITGPKLANSANGNLEKLQFLF